jgi:hypothetical protein
MRKLTTSDFDGMVMVVEDSFFDECNLINNTMSYESTYGDEVLTPTTISGVSCGFKNGNSVDLNKQNLFQTEVDATLRIPIDTTISGIDMIQMTKLNLVAISPITYKLEGEPQIGKTCVILGLKSIE